MNNIRFYRASFENIEIYRKNVKKEFDRWNSRDYENYQISLLAIFCSRHFDEIVAIDPVFFSFKFVRKISIVYTILQFSSTFFEYLSIEKKSILFDDGLNSTV